MKPLTQEWVQKADGDLAVAEREMKAGAPPNHDVVCFLCQQSLEKYLKAWLAQHHVSFPKTHDLPFLLDLVPNLPANWEVWRRDLKIVSYHAIDFHYPGKSATEEDARHALQTCQTIRAVIRSALETLLG